MIIQRNMTYFFTEVKEEGLEYVFTVIDFLIFICKGGVAELVLQALLITIEYITKQNKISHTIASNTNKIMARYLFENSQEFLEIIGAIHQQVGNDDFIFNIIITSNEVLHDTIYGTLASTKNLCLVEMFYLRKLLKEEELNGKEINMNKMNLNSSFSHEEKIKYLLKFISTKLNLINAKEEKMLDFESFFYNDISNLFHDDFFMVNEIKLEAFPSLLEIIKTDNLVKLRLYDEFTSLLQSSTAFASNSVYQNVVKDNLKIVNE